MVLRNVPPTGPSSIPPSGDGQPPKQVSTPGSPPLPPQGEDSFGTLPQIAQQAASAISPVGGEILRRLPERGTIKQFLGALFGNGPNRLSSNGTNLVVDDVNRRREEQG